MLAHEVRCCTLGMSEFGVEYNGDLESEVINN